MKYFLLLLHVSLFLSFVSCYEKTPKEKPFVFEEKYPEIAKAQKNRDPNPHIINNSKTAIIYSRPDAFGRVVAMETNLGTKMEVTGVYPSYDNPEFFEVLYGETNKGYVENSFVYFEYSNRALINMPLEDDSQIAITKETVSNDAFLWSNLMTDARGIPEGERDQFIEGWVNLISGVRQMDIKNGYISFIQLPSEYDASDGKFRYKLMNIGVTDAIIKYNVYSEVLDFPILTYEVEKSFERDDIGALSIGIDFEWGSIDSIRAIFEPNEEVKVLNYFIPSKMNWLEERYPGHKIGDFFEFISSTMLILPYFDNSTRTNGPYHKYYGSVNPWAKPVDIHLEIRMLDTCFVMSFWIRDFDANLFTRSSLKD